MNTELLKMMHINKNTCISIVGAGGKTTLMFKLAHLLSNDKVCVTTTTKIFKPTSDDYDYLYIGEQVETGFETIHKGITVMTGDIMDYNKLTALSEPLLHRCVQDFDYVLIEADGSKERPLKGWRTTEPVIFEGTNKTIGVLDISVVSKYVDDDTVFRIDEFEHITSAKRGDEITVKHLAELAVHPKGLIKNSLGDKILFINKAESDIDYKNVQQLLSELDVSCFDQIILGSLKKDDYHLVYDGKQLVNIVLASGSSSRMKENKLLMKLNGKNIIEHVLDKLINHTQHHTLMVIKDNELDSVLKKYTFKSVLNTTSHLGQSESIKTGIQQAEGADGFMFFVADQPFVKQSTLYTLISRFNLTDKIVMCRSDNHYGNPVIFPKRYYKHLISLNGDQGAKKLIQEHMYDVEFITVEAIELQDIDTRADYELYKINE